MFRFRRYRIFLLVAVVLVVTAYHLTRVDHWDTSTWEGLVGLKPDAGKTTIPDPLPSINTEPPAAVAVESPQAAVSRAAEPLSTFSPNAPESAPTVTGEEFLSKQPALTEDFGEQGEGRYEVKSRPAGQAKAYWRPQQERFPVPSQSLTKLPSGLPKALPKIQHTFGREWSSAKTARVLKQTAIREAFKHAWNGYKNHSLPHDELKPISGGFGDPFNGWGATLVDSLDSLWIMGLRDEFDEAVGHVGNIDFKTSARKDIPLFETTIRYLGGLIAAYDLSSGKYQVLLDKAVELAEVLMGAFDTPNRMPAGYYNWAPSYASQPHRASPHTVFAEIGSLSLEFTRLAQLTQQHKYYDAIARITDALEQWQQETTLPGLWPLKLDASGCKKPEVARTVAGDELQLPYLSDSPAEDPASGEESLAAAGVVKDESAPNSDGSRSLLKRQSDDPSTDPSVSEVVAAESKAIPVTNTEWDQAFDSVDCEAQPLSFEPHSTTHTYGIGAMADSTYEYFPKEYALLGGLNPQYRSMYEDAMDVVRQTLLFRPMTPENRDILFAAKQVVVPKATKPSEQTTTIYEGTHLGCFAGGMFALGSKMFGIPDDMILAEKLTDGCVWAYESTPVGIMAEDFELVPCDSLTSCTWNETKWHDALDPRLEERIQAVEAYNLKQKQLHEELAAHEEGLTHDAEVVSDPSMRKREGAAQEEPEGTSVRDNDEESSNEAAAVIPSPYVPRMPLSHEKYVAARLMEERLPPGYTKMKSGDYRLRPEAIESVFIMYRITGDETWRAKGWAMFDAVDRATRTEIANAGIKDVTSQLLEQEDTMESFWLAETLKYYYLLFSEPDLISLDDYVLNTEAHPFKRPR